MIARTLTAIGFALTLAHSPAAASEISFAPSVNKAVNACMDMNTGARTELLQAVQDGFGDWLVWLQASDSTLRMCNASGEGAVYTNAQVAGDLLAGRGAELIGLQAYAASIAPAQVDPAQVAAAVCAAVGSHLDDMSVAATVEDGMGDYLVWLKNAKEELWVCNASADAKLYSFEPVDVPINDYQAVQMRFA
jgi:hypothetical protein